MTLYRRTLHELRELLLKKEITAREITLSVLERARSVEPRVKAFLFLTEEMALQAADAADRRLQRGESLPPLAGIPIAVKNNICIEGVQTTCASKILQGFIPPYDATVIGNLKRESSVQIGVTNMDEFAMGSSTENSSVQVTRNPWDLDRVPGGSSGGSAAAVASDSCIAALGSDTGGSIRQPAALCGVVGLKPTYGRVSRYGLIAFASSLDQIGPLTKDVRDCALLLNGIAGYDPKDSTSSDIAAPDFTSALGREIRGIRLGIPREYFIEGMDPEVEQRVREAIRLFSSLGAEIREISLPHTEYAVATYYILATAEASANLSRYDGVKYGYRTKEGDSLLEMYRHTRDEGFGSEVKRRIMLGTYALSAGYYDAYYRKAQQVRTLIKRDFDDVFGQVDGILTPTSPTPAFRIGEKADNPLQMYLSDIFTISVNLGGIPAVSVPCGFTGNGLPVGLQIIGKAFDEAMVLRLAYAYEQAAGWLGKRASL